MDTLSRKFFDDVRNSISATAWEQEFPNLIYCKRTGSRGLKSRRWQNLLSEKDYTTVGDLHREEIMAIKDFLGWDYTKLIGKYKLGWKTLTLNDAQLLTTHEGAQVSFDHAIAA